MQEGVRVTSAFTTSVNVQLAPGSLTETITVTGVAPTVDVHSATAATTLRGEIVKALPTVRSYNALVALIPGVVTSANDVVTGTLSTGFPIHGGRSNEGRLSLDGLTVGGPSIGNSPTSYVVDIGAAEEVTFAAAGGLGETETGGLVVNIVPKTGGNSTQGSLFVSGTGEKLESDNLTEVLKHQGVQAASPLSKVYDISGTAGGPIVRIARGISSPRTVAGARPKARTCTTTSTPAIRRSGCMPPTSAGERIRTGCLRTPAPVSRGS